jgi:ABC-type multidrug transport system ATPase subunit
MPESEGVELARDVFRQRFGVELIVYKPTPGWRELPAFVDKLVEGCQAMTQVNATEVAPTFLRKIRLSNIGPFTDLSLNLDPHWNVLLGNNGAGKSTVLRAIALILCGNDTRASAEGAKLLRGTSNTGEIELTVGSDVHKATLTRRGDGLVDINFGAGVSPLKMGRWLALAFPPLRGISSDNPSGPTGEGSALPVVEDVLPLLSGQTDNRLSSLKQWLVNLDVRSKPGDGVSAAEAQKNVKLRDHFFKLMNEFVPGLDVKFAGVDRKTWKVSVEINKAVVGLDQISQGTSSILGWVGALLQRMYEIHGADADIEKRPAVVLIDEIDAHLHPAWQQRIIGTLSKLFPAVQFLATTHSPLIVGELDQDQIYWMERKPDGEVIASRPSQPVRGQGVAGLLESEIFGRTPTLDTSTQKLLEQQRALSLKEKLTDAERTELGRLVDRLDELGFQHQMRDPEFTEYLKQRDANARRELQTFAASAAGSAPPPEKVVPAELRARIDQVVDQIVDGKAE